MKSLFDIIRHIADALVAALQTNPANSPDLAKAQVKAQDLQTLLKDARALVGTGAIAIGHPLSIEEAAHLDEALALVARLPAVAGVPEQPKPPTLPVTMGPPATSVTNPDGSVTVAGLGTSAPPETPQASESSSSAAEPQETAQTGQGEAAASSGEASSESWKGGYGAPWTPGSASESSESSSEPDESEQSKYDAKHGAGQFAAQPPAKPSPSNVPYTRENFPDVDEALDKSRAEGKPHTKSEFPQTEPAPKATDPNLPPPSLEVGPA